MEQVQGDNLTLVSPHRMAFEKKPSQALVLSRVSHRHLAFEVKPGQSPNLTRLSPRNVVFEVKPSQKPKLTRISLRRMAFAVNPSKSPNLTRISPRGFAFEVESSHSPLLSHISSPNMAFEVEQSQSHVLTHNSPRHMTVEIEPIQSIVLENDVRPFTNKNTRGSASCCFLAGATSALVCDSLRMEALGKLAKAATPRNKGMVNFCCSAGDKEDSTKDIEENNLALSFSCTAPQEMPDHGSTHQEKINLRHSTFEFCSPQCRNSGLQYEDMNKGTENRKHDAGPSRKHGRYDGDSGGKGGCGPARVV